jgi:hypothetical protein
MDERISFLTKSALNKCAERGQQIEKIIVCRLRMNSTNQTAVVKEPEQVREFNHRENFSFNGPRLAAFPHAFATRGDEREI